jgi:hypothetical protein
MNLLSSVEADSLFEKFLQNRVQCDFVFYVKLDAFRKNCGAVSTNCIVAHHSINGVSNYYVEIQGENFRKFVLKNDAIWTNFEENFGPNEPFIEGSLYSPNDLLMPFLDNCTFRYFGPKKVCGRTTQQFIAETGNDSCGDKVRFIKISIDFVFLQALEIEYLNDKQNVVRKQRVLNLCKKNNSWLAKVVELSNRTTHERSKITIIDADFSPRLNGMLFEPKFHGEYLPVN